MMLNTVADETLGTNRTEWRNFVLTYIKQSNNEGALKVYIDGVMRMRGESRKIDR